MEAFGTRITLKRIPQFWIGLILIAVFWPLNWFLSGLRTAFLFFPLWLGYILLMDGLVYLRRGSSILNRSATQFALLFLISAPGWWLFEIINHRTKNWEYLGSEHFTGIEHFMLSTISFSTVMPAVFETAELVRSFPWVTRIPKGASIQPTPKVCFAFLFSGLTMLALTLLLPRVCYPFVWGSIVLILEPLNVFFRRRGFFDYLAEGDWRPVIALALGSLICGFFWEMWNYFSYPKWVYHTPGAEFLHVFEMPLLGYLGYLPFAWELYSLCTLLHPKRVPVEL